VHESCVQGAGFSARVMCAGRRVIVHESCVQHFAAFYFLTLMKACAERKGLA